MSQLKRTTAARSDGGDDLRSEEATTFCALIQNSAGEIGIAYLTIDGLTLELHQFVETSRSYRSVLCELSAFSPCCVVLVNTGNSLVQQGVNRVVKEHGFPQVHLVNRAAFDDTKGYTLVHKFCSGSKRAREEGDATDTNQSNYLAFGAAGALLQSLQAGELQAQPLPPGCLTLKRRSSAFHCQLSLNTIKCLGLVPDRTSESRGLKPWSLQRTLEPFLKTPLGRRLLRASLLQPSISVSTIVDRQAAIGELVESAAQRDLQACLAAAPKSLDRMLIELSGGITVSGEQAARQFSAVIVAVIRLRDTLRWLQSLREAMQPLSSTLLVSIRESVGYAALGALLDRIDEVVDPEVEQSNVPVLDSIQQCYAVRQGACSFLDEAKKRFNGVSEQVSRQMEKYVAMELDGGWSVTLTYTRKRLWHLICKRSAAARDGPETPSQHVPALRLPKGWWELAGGARGQVFCSNQELMALNQRLEHAAQECRSLSAVQLCSLSQHITARQPQLCCLLDALALLDLLSGFAAFMAARQGVVPFCRPLVAPLPGPLMVSRGFHPMHASTDPLTGACRVMQPNDLYISSSCSLNVLLGANMSGKTTYIKQVGLLVVMAQAGLWVPAEAMALHPFRTICSRMGTGDNLQENQSSMMVEAQDVVDILEMAAPGALVLVDELGRATSTSDGISLAWTVAEELLARGAFALFATHFAELARLSERHAPVRVWHLRLASDGGPRAAQRHECVAGVASDLHYGLALAEQVGLPRNVQQAARDLVKSLDGEDAACFVPSDSCAAERDLMDLLDNFMAATQMEAIPAESLEAAQASCQAWLGQHQDIVANMADAARERLGAATDAKS